MERSLAVLVVLGLAGVAAADAPRSELSILKAPPQTDPGPASLLYLNRCKGGCTIHKGADNARTHTSTIPVGSGPFTLGELSWSDADWTALVQCVREVYSPYALTVTDVPPPAGVDYNEGVVAGRAQELGLAGIGGISLLSEDCSPYHNLLSFVFGNNGMPSMDVRWLCYAVAQETGHAFGLDHSYVFEDGSSACRDPMSYRSDCGGQRFFRPFPVTCGEFVSRECSCASTQNSHEHLLEILGPGTPITAPPMVSVDFPRPNEQLFGDTVLVTAGAQRGVAALELWLNGTHWTTTPGAAFGPTGQPITQYTIEVPKNVPDGIIDIDITVKDDIGVATAAPTVTIIKGEPCVNADTCAFGQRCDAGRCLWDPPTGDVGESCSYPQFCKSGICAGDGNMSQCSQRCNLDEPNSCPTGFTCWYDFPDGICWPGDDATSGCCSAHANPAHALFGLVLLVVLRRRREAAAKRPLRRQSIDTAF